ncbi:DNA repair and recombination protein, putative h elicase [Formosa agariphila KMM 3901]|uniref:DNA repair and recombination protein, putative h elicase n=1 Tax=Formosa agariphila (strain DSM 15362 / KCTC 12365 / LMG 23005 / KMM 3901 / M-2Alg 35-1) TaxID=1347342 RepID=T2KJ38_FORAG|nr:helix-turn-helix domain-containing protein [Formosa agariphila]CDF78431.1 DNA repair and recombination protein, putative h elicase [Formosa agariphila KMM 3901]
MTINKELELAWEFVNNTNRSIFLTGKAGTGKTTFLHRLKVNSLKRMVVVAPTGVAAINAKGVTIHSFFQLPFGPILPDSDLNNPSGFNRKFNKTKINIIKSMDLLVIDEVSMVRADLLDGIDKTLRRFKNRNKVFGGVQVLMIGDLQQLSPVIKENEWHLLKRFYNNGFFFSSHAYQQCDPISIELKHIYRQENPTFIQILNEIRNNRLTESSAAELNKRFISDFTPEPDSGYISLTTHNNKAEATNKLELEKLNTKVYTYTAIVEGKFPEFSYPNSEILELKAGAQVMFIKNDPGQDKRYFNGKIGKIVDLDHDEVTVRCPGDDFNIVTKAEVWENINYTVDKETKAITEDKIGAFTQIPLRLAWSITIHKSQGLTFEKAIIDSGSAFAHGQTYVALSRCKSLEGLVLKSKITSNQIITDSNVLSFNKKSEENEPDEYVLEHSQKRFQLDLIAEVFGFYDFLYPINRILDIFYKNRSSLEGNLEAPMLVVKTAITNLLKVSNGFNTQLSQLSLEESGSLEESEVIQSRFNKAITYFKSEIEKYIGDSIKAFSFTTDNQAVGGDITKNMDAIAELYESKLFYFSELSEDFTTQKLLKTRAKAVFLAKEKPRKSRKSVVDGTINVDLFELLRVLRNEIASEHDLVHFQVFSQKSLYEMCEVLPLTKDELLQINGMGATRVEKYGTAILNVIRDYCDENDIQTHSEDTIFDEEPTKVRDKVNTKVKSLELFKAGKNIEAIALDRELNENTIFGHLASFIPTGEIKVTDLMSKETYDDLLKRIPEKTFENLSDLKNQLADTYSYAEIRLVLNLLNSKDD